jgi:hypothetical protein
MLLDEEETLKESLTPENEPECESLRSFLAQPPHIPASALRVLRLA